MDTGRIKQLAIWLDLRHHFIFALTRFPELRHYPPAIQMQKKSRITKSTLSLRFIDPTALDKPIVVPFV